MFILVKHIYDGYCDHFQKIINCSRNEAKIGFAKTILEGKELSRQEQAKKCIDCTFLDYRDDVINPKKYIERSYQVKECSGFYLEDGEYIVCKNEVEDKYGTVSYEVKEVEEI